MSLKHLRPEEEDLHRQAARRELLARRRVRRGFRLQPRRGLPLRHHLQAHGDDWPLRQGLRLLCQYYMLPWQAWV